MSAAKAKAQATIKALLSVEMASPFVRDRHDVMMTARMRLMSSVQSGDEASIYASITEAESAMDAWQGY